jgi:DNA-binding response OmpR family regulator
VFGVLKQSGGSVWVYSEPGLGASFKLFLPVAEEATPAVTERTAQHRPTGSETILLIEDEGGVRQLVEATLTRAGYTVLPASHPAEALRIAANPDQHIDLLLTDVVMPDRNGASLSREIRQGRPGLRVLFMSGFADEAIERHGVFTEGTVFLQKPFTVSDLACKVRQVLDQAAVR